MVLSFEYSLDILAAGMLALAAAVRGTRYGMHFTGAVVLGCLAGMASPVARDMLLGFGVVTPLEDGAYTAAVLAGALAGRFAALCKGEGVFFLSDAAGMGLAAAVGAERGAFLGLEPLGCILLGLCAGTVGGLLRDVCLGDIPRALEAEFYVTAAAVGCMFTLALGHLGMTDTIQIIGGTVLVVALRSVGRALALKRGDHGE